MKLKISRLFHWLYATLMFLPILMFIPSCLYFAFNDNAQAQEETQNQPVYYQSNEVTSISDLFIGNVYHWSDSFVAPELPSSPKLMLLLTQTDNMTFIDTSKDVSALRLYYTTTGIITIQCLYTDNTSSWFELNNRYFDIVIAEYGMDFSYAFNIVSSLGYSDIQLIKEYQEVTYSLSISDSINYAWERTWNLPVFAWTQNSFVTAPFSYITGLFGLSSDNSINYVFTYFVSISICWLVFDLIMYVPNLAHRWLDRSAIE